MSNKHSIEKIMNFTAALHRKESQGKRAYLNEIKDSTGRTIAPFKLTWKEKFIPGAVMITCVVISSWSLVDLIANRSPELSTIAIMVNTVIFFFAYKAFTMFRELKVNYQESWHKRRLHFEPEAVWSIDYPTQGKRAKYIEALLGARMLCRKMILFTAIPMDAEVIDARVTHLIKELAKSTDEEAHPYLIREIMSFCSQAVKEMDFYHPIISLQDDLNKMDITQ